MNDEPKKRGGQPGNSGGRPAVKDAFDQIADQSYRLLLSEGQKSHVASKGGADYLRRLIDRDRAG